MRVESVSFRDPVRLPEGTRTVRSMSTAQGDGDIEVNMELGLVRITKPGFHERLVPFSNVADWDGDYVPTTEEKESARKQDARNPNRKHPTTPGPEAA